MEGLFSPARAPVPARATNDVPLAQPAEPNSTPKTGAESKNALAASTFRTQASTTPLLAFTAGLRSELDRASRTPGRDVVVPVAVKKQPVLSTAGGLAPTQASGFDGTVVTSLAKGSHEAVGENTAVNVSSEFTSRAPLIGAKNKASGEVGLPEWLRTRAYMTFEYLTPEYKSRQQPKHSTRISALPLSGQETVVVDDVLNLLLGVDGRFISISAEPSTGEVSFDVDPTLDMSLGDLVRRVLPLARFYVRITRAVHDRSARMNSGAVQHALCEAISETVKSHHLVFVTRLETQQREHGLSMQQMWYYSQSNLRMLSTLDEALVVTRTRHGGAALSALFELLQRTGEPESSHLVRSLLSKAAVPFFSMMSSWVYRGIVRDYHGEFFVSEDSTVLAPNRTGSRDPFASKTSKANVRVTALQVSADEAVDSDGYWEERFSLVSENIPTFIGVDVALRALQCGKYLNVIEDCGEQAVHELAESDQFFSFPAEEVTAGGFVRNVSGGPSDYATRVADAFRVASSRLLELLRLRFQLRQRLRSVRHYLLLDQGDWLVHFMDIAGRELTKKVGLIAPERLRSMLELSFRTSIADGDEYKDDVRPVLLPNKILDQLMQILSVTADTNDSLAALPNIQAPTDLTGLEAFALDYRVAWPLSLVLSHKAMTKYQLLFRHVFLCKFVERKLNNAWGLQKTLKQVSMHLDSHGGGAISATFSLRHRMLHFMQQLLHYMAFEVFEPNSAILEGRIASAATLDDVLTAHNDDFLDACLKECLLTDKPLIKLVTKLLTICVLFTSFTEQFIRASGIGEVESGVGSGAKTQARLDQRRRMLTERTRQQMIDPQNRIAVQKFDENFSSTLNELITRLRRLGGKHTAGLAVRLDFSGFYASQAAEQRRAALSRLGASLRPAHS